MCRTMLFVAVQKLEICKEVIDYYEAIYGELKGTIELESKDLESTIKSNLDWKFFNYLLNTIGAPLFVGREQVE